MYITNAFSLNMIKDNNVTVSIISVPTESVTELLTAGMLQSAIGHSDTAAVVGNMLWEGFSFEANRVSISLERGESIIVAQYKGPRLAEGATKLPEGAVVEFSIVTIDDNPIASVRREIRGHYLASGKPAELRTLALNWGKNVVG